MINEEISELLNHWRAVSEGGPVVDFGWTMRSLVPYFYDQLGNQLRVLFIHRHPVEVAASFKLIGSYSIYNSSTWAITPNHPQAMFPQFSDRWTLMSAFERCLYYWLEVNASAIELSEKLPGLDIMTLSSTDLFQSDEVLDDVVRFTGFDCYRRPLEKSLDRNRREVFLLERRPIKEEWREYLRHPEIVEFAEGLGYDMSIENVEFLISKYQLPCGVVPWLRNRTGYWAFKERFGKALRVLGLR